MNNNIVLLPEIAAHNLPPSLASKKKIVIDNKEDAQRLPVILNSLKTKLVQTPEIILGSVKTPVLFWLAVYKLFPDTLTLCYEYGDVEVEPVLRDIKTLELWCEHKEPIEKEKETQSHSVEKKAPPKKINKKPQIATQSLSYQSDKQLLHEISQKSSWDSTDMHVVERLMQEVIQREEHSPGLLKKAREKKQQGEMIKKLNSIVIGQLKLQNKQNNLNAKEIKNYIKEQSQEYRKNKEIQYSVNHYIQRQIKFYQNKQVNYAQQRPVSLVVQPRLREGIHPNNLRYLKPALQWTIVIDETGTLFDHEAESLSINNKELGRVVALVIPKRSWGALANLKKHHATNAKDSKNDQVINELLKADVGVFGFTIKDDGLTVKSRWISSISALVRWLMLILPINQSDNTSVEFNIEQRGDYTKDYPLELLVDQLESELNEINSERFKQCHIKLQFINKDDSPYNGYVDTIAHMWGSQARSSKDRLKKSQLAGHCLLKPNVYAIERLYLALNGKKQLTSAQWYDICGLLANEPASSLLHGFMSEIGQSVRHNKILWQQYMNFVSQKLHNKNYQLSSLGGALDWLDRYRPEGCQLSAMAELHWISAKLALANHLGQVEYKLAEKAILLASELKNESAVAACDVVLRIAITCTNNFEFELAQNYIALWLKEEIAVVGIANHAKLQSSMGQVLAFQHHYNDAIVYFERAINLFKLLSDQDQAEKDIQQSNTYKLIAIMGDNDHSEDFVPLFWDHLGTKKQCTSIQITQNLLASQLNDERSLSYQHHLMLRAFIYYPEYFKIEISAYLKNSHLWGMDEYHPWEWIAAYRGWLLVNNGQTKQAQEQFKMAVDICFYDEQNYTLQWIGLVIMVLAGKLGIKEKELFFKADYLTILKQKLPHAPYTELEQWKNAEANTDHSVLISQLKRCVPFNFH